MRKTIQYGDIKKIIYEYSAPEIINYLREKDNIMGNDRFEVIQEWKYDKDDEIEGLIIIETNIKYKEGVK